MITERGETLQKHDAGHGMGRECKYLYDTCLVDVVIQFLSLTSNICDAN